ncbi:MAG: 3-dehydroquinate synthase [candidate division Zixibacteria bacterium]
MIIKITDLDIIVGRDLFGDLKHNVDFTAYSSLFLLTDNNVYARYLDDIRKNFDGELKLGRYFTLPSGEKYKTLEWVGQICEKMLSSGLDRKSMLVALGGGVVTDIGGFAASIYMRGIDFINVPTTLVGQIDASLGGKCGVNLESAKNIIGLFSLPRKVIIDPAFLDTLSGQQMRDGMVELLKIAAVADSSLFGKLESINYDLVKVNDSIKLELIERAAGLKLAVVNKDFRESGYRMILNFGHTTGHAIETFAGYGEFSHGKAVAIGILVAAELSGVICGLGAESKERLKNAAKSLLQETNILGIGGDDLWEMIQFDKKKDSGDVKFVLLEKLGKSRIKTVSKDQFLNAYNTVYGEFSE